MYMEIGVWTFIQAKSNLFHWCSHKVRFKGDKTIKTFKCSFELTLIEGKNIFMANWCHIPGTMSGTQASTPRHAGHAVFGSRSVSHETRPRTSAINVMTQNYLSVLVSENLYLCVCVFDNNSGASGHVWVLVITVE